MSASVMVRPRAFEDLAGGEVFIVETQASVSVQTVKIPLVSDVLGAELQQTRSDLALLRIDVRGKGDNLQIGLVRIEQLLDARWQAVRAVERPARLEERVAARPAPAA